MLKCHLRNKSGAFPSALCQPLHRSLFVRIFAKGPIAQLDRASDADQKVGRSVALGPPDFDKWSVRNSKAVINVIVRG